MAFPPEYQSAPYNFTEWQTTALQRHGEHLTQRLNTTEIPRQRETFDRELGHVAFELVSRRQDFARFYAELQASDALAAPLEVPASAS
jgi:hypothetical protein